MWLVVANTSRCSYRNPAEVATREELVSIRAARKLIPYPKQYRFGLDESSTKVFAVGR